MVHPKHPSEPGGAEASQSTESEKHAREERIDRLMGELRESIAKTDAIIERWEAEGILRPER